MIATFDSRADERKNRRNKKSTNGEPDEAIGDLDGDREFRKRWKAVQKARTPEEEEQRAMEAVIAYSGKRQQDGPLTE